MFRNDALAPSDSAPSADRGTRVGKRAIVAAAIGTALEWYDVFVYLYFSAIIAKLFFPAGDEWVSLLVTVGAFGVTYMAKPVGALVISSYADRVSRKAALSLTLSLMALGVGIIAVTPTYAEVGIAATLLMLSARLIQGFSSGGEYGAATAFLVERAPASLRGYYSSFNIAAIGLTSVLGGGVGYVINNRLSAQQIAAWGWRIPFIFGLAILPASIYLRRSIPELSKGAMRARAPLKEALAQHKLLSLLGIGAFVPVTVSNYALAFYLPTYAIKNLGIVPTVAFLATAVYGLLQCVLAPVFGYASDRYGRKPVMIAAAWAIAVASVPSFIVIVKYPSTATLLLALSILSVLTTAYQAAIPALLCDLYPPHLRATGVAIVHDFTATVFGGFSPFFITLMISLTGSNLVPGIYIAAAATVGLICLRRIE